MQVALAGDGGGTVSSDPSGIDCGGDCSQLFNFGTTVTLATAPDTDSTFTGWSGGGCSGTGACVVTMTGARNVTATFELGAPDEYTLSVFLDGTGGGTVTSVPAGIDCGEYCSETFFDGTVVTLTVAADTSSTFTGWSGSGCSGMGACVVTMTGARYVTASFTGDAVGYPLYLPVVRRR